MKFKKILVLAPHTDDIELGCGGLLSRYKDSAEIDAIAFTSAQPLGFAELELNTPDDGKTYDLLGRELLEIPKGTIYIKNRKKFIR